VNVSAQNGVSPAVGDPVIVNTMPSTVDKPFFAISHAWVQSSTKIRFYLHGHGYRANNNNNTRQVQITVLK